MAGAIRDHDLDPAEALRQLQSQGCLEQHSQNFDIWQWIVPSAHAASCTLTTLSGKQITITDREGCIGALVDAFYADTVGIVANRQQFEEGLMKGVKGQGQDFVNLFSDPTGMAKSLTNIAWEIANDPVAASRKYGFNAADSLYESSALYLKALANNDYVTAGEYMGRFAMDVAIALGTAEAGSAIEGALFGAREAEALKAVEKVEQATTNKVQLINDLVSDGIKVTRENVIEIQKLPNGKTVWLETGSATGPRPAGLNHIVADHGTDFANKGIAEANIPDALFTALRDGNIVGYQGTGTGRPIYKYEYNGQIQYTEITVGNNGFIVGANPTSGP